ncbi:toll/interleukin-1 receptor domain-containing protein [uncultured Rikenella sp.]|uniref:toll/interleukin-1 receptor domain-containing protein n=1 Tax=uncultured Rikenella sp. TaxID=368003 RepID=UPI0026383881|nr:toll/interleukin-1 receptor domain-containing protein [uncultured Rikenella sp.]
MVKVFISHSSEDKDIVDLFKNIILNAGLGILDADIAYTSAPETGVPTGGNIPQYIKDNLADCDFVFFMISDNYRKSEVCLNEMGAAWALDKNVKPLLLHNVSFESIGWLYRANLCAKIDDADRLDELRDEFLERQGSCPKTVVWNRQKAEFLAKMATFGQNTTALIRIDTSMEEGEELGLLDYREAFDNHIALFCQTMSILTSETNQLNEKVQARTKQLNSLNIQRPNASQVRGIMIGFAKDMDQMSHAIDHNAPKLAEHFKAAIEEAIKMQQCFDTNQNIKDENRKALNNLIQSQISAKDTTTQGREALLNIPNIEKSQISAKNRLVKGYSTLIKVYDECITKATELLKA